MNEIESKKFQRVIELFDVARLLDGPDREAYLETCHDDAEIVTEVRRLLQVHDIEDGPLDSPIDLSSDWPSPDSMYEHELPEQIGQYRLLRQIGAGGMGAVFLAEQENPRRHVALKLIRPGLATNDVLKRFAFEAEILGRLQHSGIAQIFEAGVFEVDGGKGYPFFAMEYVDGQVLSEFVCSKQLGLTDRLRLFAKICDAVHHAHQRGVIHRDLKPGNVIVDSSGNPKVVDFGIARVIDPDLQVSTALTDMGQLMGTLPYMSPEQIEGRVHKVDTRSDVYSLGVVLYELVSDQLPFDVSDQSLVATAKAILENDPNPLSNVNRAYRGDLNTIALKALEKDPDQRYGSAREFGEDTRRFLNNEPISARPQSTWYQARRFTRRNRVFVGGLVGIFVALIAGIITTTWQANRAIAQRDIASEQALRARETAALLSRMIRAVSPANARGTDPTIRQMLEESSLQLQADQSIHPAVAADTHRLLADAYWSLGEYGDAQFHSERAVALHTKVSGPTAADTLESESTIALILSRLDRDDEAIGLARSILDRANDNLEVDDPVLLTLINTYAFTLNAASNPDFHEVARWFRKYYEMALEEYGRNDVRTVHAASNLGATLVEVGQLEESERLLRYVFETRSAWLSDDHPATLVARHNLSFLLARQGENHKAAELSRSQLEMADRVLGFDHLRTIGYRLHLGRLESRLGNMDESEQLVRSALETSVQRFSPHHEIALNARGFLVEVLLRQQKVQDAESFVLEQYEVCTEALGVGHPSTVRATTLLFDLAESKGDIEQMKFWAEGLRGTEWEKPAQQMIREAERKADNDN